MGSRMISSALAAEWSMSISMSIPQWQARKGRRDAGKVIASRSMQPTYHQIYSKRAGAEADRSREKFTPGPEVESASASSKHRAAQGALWRGTSGLVIHTASTQLTQRNRK